MAGQAGSSCERGSTAHRARARHPGADQSYVRLRLFSSMRWLICPKKVGVKPTPSGVGLVDQGIEDDLTAVSLRSPRGQVKPAQDDDRLLWEKAAGTYPALDMARIVCVFLAVVDHAGTPYGEANVMYVQAWVLQYLYLVCGICFGMTSRSLVDYLGRLAMYFFVGVGCNLSAWIIMRMDYINNAWNVIYQFFFVFGLMLFTLLLNPLKRYLQWIVSGKSAKRYNVGLMRSLLYAIAGLLIIKGCFMFIIVPFCQMAFASSAVNLVKDMGDGAKYWGLPKTEEEAVGFLAEALGIFQLSISSLFLAFFFPLVTPRLSLVPWAIMLNLYSHRVVEFRGSEARLFNSFDMTMLGLTSFYCGIAGRRVIGKYMTRYYFGVLFLSAVLWPAGTFRRLDEHPTSDPVLRARSTLLEAVWVVLFLTGMERMVEPEIFSEDRMQYLQNWALLLFLVHKAVQLLLPVPWSWLVLVGLLPVCRMMQGNTKPQSNGCAHEPLLEDKNGNMVERNN